MKAAVSFVLVLAIALVGAAKLTMDSESINEANQNEDFVAYSNSARKIPGDNCIGDITGRDCDFKNLLLCMNGTCSCPVMEHEEVIEFMAAVGFPVYGESRFLVNTTWITSRNRCVGLEGSLCVTDKLPDMITLPVALECSGGLPCRAYPDPALQNLVGRCSASTLSITHIIPSLSILALFVMYYYSS